MFLQRGNNEDVKLAAAFELYQRNSRFLATEEFAEYKPACVELELQRAAVGKASHHPNRVLDALGALFTRSKSNQAAIHDVDQKQTVALASLKNSTAESIENTGEAISDLANRTETRITRLTNTFVVWLGIISIGNIAALVFHFAHSAR